MYKVFFRFSFVFFVFVFCCFIIQHKTFANNNLAFNTGHEISIFRTLPFENSTKKTYQNKTIRVLLSNKGNFEHNKLTFSSEDELFLTSNNQLIINTVSPVTISLQDDNFIIETNGVIQKILSNQKIIISTNTKPVEIHTFAKAGKKASYTGKLEISLSKNGKLRVINIIDIEDYLKGVVPNEMPVYFGLEALKAQAISARGYAYRDFIYKTGDYDVCDTTGSQVYNGYNSYKTTSNQAVDETMGQFALYKGNIILSLYSSTSGGHTENYENAFSDNGVNTKFPANPIPYLKGVPDFDYSIDLSKEKNVKDFYLQKPNSFELQSPKYRWEITWTKEELENILIKNLMKNSSSKFVTPQLKNANDFGKLQYIDVPKRGVSGKAMYLRITTDKGVFLIAKEIMIRKIMTKNNSWLPSANIVIEQISDGKNVTGYKVTGGGFGHGVGMSQFGAAGMAKQGYNYEQILKHYYTGISVGSYPVECNLKNKTNCSTSFYYNGKNARLIMEFILIPHNLTFNINGTQVTVTTEQFTKKEGEINIKRFLKKGINTISIVDNESDTFDFANRNLGKVKFYALIEGKNEK